MQDLKIESEGTASDTGKLAETHFRAAVEEGARAVAAGKVHSHEEAVAILEGFGGPGAEFS